MPAFTLAPLTLPVIEQFVARWHVELVRAALYQPETAQQTQRRLVAALQDPKRTELREMAGTPLLLTMMVRVNYHRGLPDSRAELYELFVRQLLYEWERQKQEDPGQPAGLDLLLNQADVSKGSLDLALNRLAHGIHGQARSSDTVDIPAVQLRAALEKIHSGAPAAKAAWAVQVLFLIADRSGLIYWVDEDVYKFSHRTFQEYLAARFLASGDSAAKLANFKACSDEENWREAFLLGIGYLTYVLPQYDDILTIVDELLPTTPGDPGEWRRVVLLGEAYVRLLGAQRAHEAVQQKRAAQVAQNMPLQLTAAMQNPALSPALRLEAGLLLADLELDPPGLDDFVRINAVRTLGYEYRIGKYPVTNQQFRRFMGAGGYAPENELRWWSERGRKHKHDYRLTAPRYWDDARFNHSPQPVVGVSWYEAQAYCAWLTENRRRTGEIEENEEIRLPTQAEWGAAARSKHSGEYPWNGTFDPAFANTKESDLGQTTPVHLYPQGATPDGIWDLSGNIWEWTNEIDKDEWVYLKGGSWYDDAKKATASNAVRSVAWSNWNAIRGFRVVVVPISR